MGHYSRSKVSRGYVPPANVPASRLPGGRVANPNRKQRRAEARSNKKKGETNG